MSRDAPPAPPTGTGADGPLVTVIIPSYNQGVYIERTLRSVLLQDYPNIQLIVADGGSTDSTIAVLEQYSNSHPNLEWFSERDRGYADAVNKGLKRARGEIVGIQSSDDYYAKGAVGEAVGVLRRNPAAILVSGRNFDVDVDDNILDSPPERNHQWYDLWDFLTRRFIPPQHSTFARRSAIDGVGGPRIDVDFAADVDLWMRMLSTGNGVLVNRRWSFRRRHPEQRDSTGRDRFAEASLKSVMTWVSSSDCPPVVAAHRKVVLASGWSRRADYFFASGNFEVAQESLRKAFELNPLLASEPYWSKLAKNAGMEISLALRLAHRMPRFLSAAKRAEAQFSLKPTSPPELPVFDEPDHDPRWHFAVDAPHRPRS